MSVSTNGSRRRIDRLGVHSIDHLCFSVPSIKEADEFFCAFGLCVTKGAQQGIGVSAFGHPHVWMTLVPGERKKLQHISFGAFEGDMAAFDEHLKTLGVILEGPPPGFEDDGLWFRDPHGVLLQIRAAEKVMPDNKTAQPTYPVEAGKRGAMLRDEAPVIRPDRMSHALFFTPDIESSIRFYQEILGVRLSDHSGPVAFMHGPHGSDHHMIAFAESNGVGYHHSAWDVRSINEVGLGATQMEKAGYDQGWGLGRHVLGSNYFHYIRDPWGSYAEYSHDIDYVAAKDDWHPTTPSAANSLYLWGPKVPADFVTNYEAENGHE